MRIKHKQISEMEHLIVGVIMLIALFAMAISK
jgi:hypothetical protein